MGVSWNIRTQWIRPRYAICYIGMACEKTQQIICANSMQIYITPLDCQDEVSNDDERLSGNTENDAILTEGMGGT